MNEDPPAHRLLLIGLPRVSVGGAAPVPLGPREGALLAWLAIEGPTPRARLAQLLWPDSEPEAARNALRQRLFQLRRTLGVALVDGSQTVALAAGVGHDLEDSDDVLAETPQDFGRELGEWLTLQRERRLQCRCRRMAEAAAAAEAARDFPQALAIARDLLALEPLSEEAHRRVMRLHYLAGDRPAALLAFDQCERMLKDEVGTRPSAQTLELLRTIDNAPADRAAPESKTVPAAVLRPPRLIGRERELSALSNGWKAGQVLAIAGEAGMGKSRLLQAFVHEAGPGGVIATSARPGDAGVPFATLSRLLRALGDESSAEGAGARDSLLAELSRRLAARPALRGVALDDLHFADSASIDLFRSVILGDEASPLRWVLAHRPNEVGPALRALLDSLVEKVRLLPLALAPLSEPALAELVDSLALPGLSGEVLASGLWRRTGGNPLFVLETLKQAWVEQTWSLLAEGAGALPRPESVMRLIERRIAQLSPQALMLARCAAVAGQEFSTALATQVLGVPALMLVDAWTELEHAQVLRDQVFTHDLYHEAALASVPAAIARHLHGDVAAHLEGSAAAPATLARHWLAAHRPERALASLERAAKAAQAALDAPMAAGFLSQLADARGATGDDEGAFAAARQAVEVLRNHASGDELEAATGRLMSLARHPRHRAMAFEARGVMHHIRGAAPEAAEAVAAGLAEATLAGDDVLQVNLLNLHGIVLRRAGRLKEARAALLQALGQARGSAAAGQDGEVDLPAVLNNLALVLQEMDDHTGAIALLEESATLQPDPMVRARVLNNLAISMEERGQSARAYEQRLAAARLCAAAQTPGTAELMLAISLGANARNLSRFRDAMTHLSHAATLAAQVSHWREEDLHRQYVSLWIELGRSNLAREALESAERVSEGRAAALPTVALARARYLISIGQDARALLDRVEAELRQASDHRSLRRLLVCKAQVQTDEEAAAAMRQIIDSPALADNAGAAIPAKVRLAQALLSQGRDGEAVLRAEEAATAMAHAQPLEMSCAEVWLTLARAHQAAGHSAEASAAAASGGRWVRSVASEHLDGAYRDGYLNRNPVNAELLALEARLGA